VSDNLSEEKTDPVARIDFLATDGSVGDRAEYFSEEEFLREVEEHNYYGVPMVIVLYRGRDGNTIPRTFIKDLDPLPQGFRVEPAPSLRKAKLREDRGEER